MKDTNYYDLSLNGELVDEFDLRAALISLNSSVESYVSTYVGHISSDVKIANIDETTITLIAISTFATGTTGDKYEMHTGSCSVTTDNNDRWAGKYYKCGVPYVNNGWAVDNIRNGALNCLRRYVGPPIGNPMNTPCYTYINEIAYSSFAFNPQNPKLPINVNYLLGHSGALFSNHVGSVHYSTCVSATEQNAYAVEVYNEILSKLGKERGVTNLSMYTNVNPVDGYTNWQIMNLGTARRVTHLGCIPSTIITSLTYL